MPALAQHERQKSETPDRCREQGWLLKKSSPAGRSFDLRVIFLRGIGFLFCYLRSARWLILEIWIFRKRASRFRFWAVAARTNCSRTCLSSPQARPAQSDLVLQLHAKSASTSAALALRCRESRRDGRSLSCPLWRRFVDVDRDLPISGRWCTAISASAPDTVFALPCRYGFGCADSPPRYVQSLYLPEH